jgi:ABC-type dipeptide/oligopeptide/nickel transport system ATPase component
MELHIRHNVPVLLVGDTGTGKSFYVQNMLMNQLSEQEYVPAFITFTAQTTANQTQVWQCTKSGQVPDLIARNRYPIFFNPFHLSHNHTPNEYCC